MTCVKNVFLVVVAGILCFGSTEVLWPGAVEYQGGGGWSVQTPPKFRSFDKVEPDCKLSRKCLVFLFQHPN